MSSAAARAEARRKAILARGGDRLAKLTTSARGEDAPAYMRDEKSLAPPPKTNLGQFVGEDTPVNTPPTMSRSVSDSYGSSTSNTASASGMEGLDSNTWSQEQQQLFTALLNAAGGGGGGGGGGRGGAQDAQMLQQQQQQLLAAMMGGMGAGGGGFPPPRSRGEGQGRATSAPPPGPNDDPLSALLAMSSGGQAPMADFLKPSTAAASSPSTPKTLLEKLLPLIHIVAAWALLAYFVLVREPQAYSERTHGAVKLESGWARWAELSSRRPGDGWGVQAVPFFWAFTTLTIVLHTWRIFRGLDPVRPPTIIAMAVMHLPPPFPSLIMNGLKYLQIGSVFLDDIAALLFGVGILIWLATWFA